MKTWRILGLWVGVVLWLWGCAGPKALIPDGPPGPPVLRTLIGTAVSGSVTHAHVCAAAATSSTTDIDCPDWNDSHVFGGTAAAQGLLPYYDTGETTHLNWTTNGILFDETTTSVRLFGATIGASGVRVLGLGCASVVAPTTSPADTVQWWCADSSGAGTASLFLRDEVGTQYYSGGFAADTGKVAIQTSTGRAMSWGHGGTGNAAWIGTDTAEPLLLQTTGTARIRIDTSGNVGLNASSFGTNAAGVFEIFAGTAPTTAPTDVTAFWTADRNGAGTNAPWVRTEDSGINERLLAMTIQATDMAERTTTSTTTVDLTTLTTNIPTGDAFALTCRFRKSAGSATAAQLGVKLNATQIITNFNVTTAVSQAEDGIFQWGGGRYGAGIRPGLANYTRTATLASGITYVSGTGAAGAATESGTALAAAIPSAAITSVTITGAAVNASQTLAIRDCVVYRLSTN